jgi:hypothetical protein
LNKWVIQKSSKELPVSVFDSAEGPFFAGYIAAALQERTGPYTKGTTRFSKGYASFQTFSVEKAYGKAFWLRTGGQENLMQRLSSMKGFTKDYWGLRGTIAALLKSIKPIKVSDINTYFLPKSEIVKHIRTKLPFENGGLFRTEEISYLSERYSTVKTMITKFMVMIDNPTEDFIEHFLEAYTPLKTAFESVDREIKLLAVNRSKELFPQGKKKGLLKFKALSLDEKIESLNEEKQRMFVPESLPGIKRTKDSEEEIGTPDWYNEVYEASSAKSHAVEVISSWYNYHHSD